MRIEIGGIWRFLSDCNGTLLRAGVESDWSRLKLYALGIYKIVYVR